MATKGLGIPHLSISGGFSHVTPKAMAGHLEPTIEKETARYHYRQSCAILQFISAPGCSTLKWMETRFIGNYQLVDKLLLSV